MKKLIAILMVAILCLSTFFVSCDKKEKENKENNGKKTESSEIQVEEDMEDMKDVKPTEVSIKLILAKPEEYIGKYVKIKEQMVLSYNDLSKKQFHSYKSDGTSKYDYDTRISIDVNYENCDNVDDLIMMDLDYPKVYIIGKVKSGSFGPYIDAREIIFE